MEYVSIADIDSPLGDVDVRRLSEPLQTSDIAINLYRLNPGDSFPAGLHTHADQEEVFVVLEGRAAFETLLPPADPAQLDGLDGYEGSQVRVAESEAIRFAPGDFQSGRNAADGESVVLAIGAPRGTDDIRLPIPCPTCGHAPLQLDTDGSEPTFRCLDCTEEHSPAPCPECGDPDLQVTLGEEGLMQVECPSCGAGFDEPPIRA